MYVSYNWLKELVDHDLAPQALADRLTMAGFEVEEIIDRRSWADGVVVGKILDYQRHPDAEKLGVCTVAIGEAEPLTIVCGASNAKAGIYVAVAPVGVYLPTIDLKLRRAKLRGVYSHGMICSLYELGIEKESSGIHIFDQEYPLGQDVRPLLGLDDIILDVTSTANRADALSMVGIAREVAALTGAPLKLPITEAPLVPQGEITVSVEDTHACPAYFATLIEGVHIQPSPQWLQRRLEAAGQRPINNLVDITNYILLEWGQPLHAFDAETLGQDIHALALGVRFARAEETLTTLDGTERKLGTQSHLITSDDQPVALAGVMGGETTEVRATSQHILLEAALFDPATTRRSARAHGLRSEASARYERGVDASALDYALDRALRLILDLTGGKVVSQTRLDHRVNEAKTILFRSSRFAQVMGDALPLERMEQQLKNLGFDVQSAPSPDEQPAYLVSVPGFRQRDVEREIDLIEEIARTVGYDYFSLTLPSLADLGGALTEDETALRRLRAGFRGAGLTEVLHNSFVPASNRSTGELSTKQAQTLARFIGVARDAVTIANPLTADYAALRTELLPGLFASLKYNLEQGNPPLQAFEIGRVFSRTEDGIEEIDHLAGILSGAPAVGTWQKTSQPWDFFSAKGLLEQVLSSLGVHAEYQPDHRDERFHPGRTASLWLSGRYMGIFGQIHPRLASKEDLPAESFGFELDLDEVLAQILDKEVRYQPFSSYPALDRDLAFFCSLEVPASQLTQTMQHTGGALLESVALFDEYRGKNVPEGQRSLAFRLVYRAPDRTLTDQDVEPVQQNIREMLKERYRVELRS
jgi:phenylalanyl-tRNA synthetase beta chain